MMFSAGWCVVRSSRDAYARLADEHQPDDVYHAAQEEADALVRAADSALFDALETKLAGDNLRDMSWNFRRQLNYETGLLTFTQASNHRGSIPSSLEVLYWLAENGPASYGLVYLRDDEDEGESGRARGRDGTDHSNEFRVWRLLRGKVDELADPFLSPIIPVIDDFE